MDRTLHEIDDSHLHSVLEHGLKQGARGVTTDEDAVMETDRLLDSLRSRDIEKAGLCREMNLYGYMVIGDEVVDIVDGKRQPMASFLDASSHAVLELTIDPHRCYVSDLDAYDALKHAMHRFRPVEELRVLAQQYWSRVVPLTSYHEHDMARPELIITYDIPPQDISVVKVNPSLMSV